MHQTVLYQEALDSLNIRSDGVYVDCTFGRGGHSAGILERLRDSGRLLALDRDPDAINSIQAKQMMEDPRFRLCHACFSELAEIIDRAGLKGKVNGILMDLGVSSPQLDDSQRGFSFLRSGPLDMRMDTTTGMTAAEYLATVSERELVRVLFEYGEERFARRIARAILARRQTSPLLTTLDLASLVENSLPSKEKHKHPATRTFQAIRIAINRELDQLKDALNQAMDVLAPRGRLVVIAFHSLEDRIVKRFIRHESGSKHDPGRLPVREQDIEKGRLIRIGKAIRASAQEVLDNPRSRSAIMRVAEKR